MKLSELFDLSGDIRPPKQTEPITKTKTVDDVEESLLQLAYDQVDGKEAFACMYVVAGEVINALHRMASYNPLFVERLNHALLHSAERAKAETTKLA